MLMFHKLLIRNKLIIKFNQFILKNKTIITQFNNIKINSTILIKFKINGIINFKIYIVSSKYSNICKIIIHYNKNK